MRTLLFVALLAVILIVGYFALIFAVFSSNPPFYIALTFSGTLVLIVLTFLTIFFRQKMKKFLCYAWMAFPLLVMVSCLTFKKYGMYDEEIPRVSENDFDLLQYQPFTDSTKAVFLNEPSALLLTDSLPTLDGATALYPLYSAFAQAVYPEGDYPLSCYDNCIVDCNNTTQAYNNIVNGYVDVIFVAGPSKEQMKYAKEQNVELQKTVIAKEAFVFFVNANNPVESLTIEQVQDIYSGRITNWEEVGGNDEGIRAFQRNEGSGSQTAFLSFMQGKKVIEPIKENRVGGMGGVVSMVSDYGNYGNSIGFSFRFFMQSMVGSPDVKILKINGVYPDVESVRNSQYPIAGDVYAITTSRNNNPNVTKLLNWILSEQGQYLVEKTGYCPIK